jgi:predicted Fe-S protein YdhL (DUF1289 family)
MNNINNIKSPCIHVCTHDSDNICLGCYRSLEEIRKWYVSTDEEKLETINNAEKRRAHKDQKDQYERFV